jgi:hypothetical protein
LILLCRCGQGIAGLRDQGAINQVVYKFVCHYNNLFRDENEDPPELQWVRNNLIYLCCFVKEEKEILQTMYAQKYNVFLYDTFRLLVWFFT